MMDAIPLPCHVLCEMSPSMWVITQWLCSYAIRSDITPKATILWHHDHIVLTWPAPLFLRWINVISWNPSNLVPTWLQFYDIILTFDPLFSGLHIILLQNMQSNPAQPTFAKKLKWESQIECFLFIWLSTNRYFYLKNRPYKVLLGPKTDI